MADESQPPNDGPDLYRKFGIDLGDPNSMIVVGRDRVLRGSDAVLAILTGLGWAWRALAAFRLIPPAPRSTAIERSDRNDFIFDARIGLPIMGDVAHYRDRLHPV